jgi:hypothetical protein
MLLMAMSNGLTADEAAAVMIGFPGLDPRQGLGAVDGQASS